MLVTAYMPEPAFIKAYQVLTRLNEAQKWGWPLRDLNRGHTLSKHMKDVV